MARVVVAVRKTSKGIEAISLLPPAFATTMRTYAGALSDASQTESLGAIKFIVEAAQSATKIVSHPYLKGDEKTVVVKLRPLVSYEVQQFWAIDGTKSIVDAARLAWKLSDSDGLERGFFIYRKEGGKGYYPGKTVTGTKHNLPTLLATFKETNVVTGFSDSVVAYFHTHPGHYPLATEADNYDENFGRRTHAFIIIRHYKGLRVGGY